MTGLARHYLGSGLLPACDASGAYVATPVIGDVDCPECRAILQRPASLPTTPAAARAALAPVIAPGRGYMTRAGAIVYVRPVWPPFVGWHAELPWRRADGSVVRLIVPSASFVGATRLALRLAAEVDPSRF